MCSVNTASAEGGVHMTTGNKAVTEGMTALAQFMAGISTCPAGPAPAPVSVAARTGTNLDTCRRHIPHHPAPQSTRCRHGGSQSNPQRPKSGRGNWWDTGGNQAVNILAAVGMNQAKTNGPSQILVPPPGTELVQGKTCASTPSMGNNWSPVPGSGPWSAAYWVSPPSGA